MTFIPRRSVLGLRIIVGTTGIGTIVSGMHLLLVAIYRLSNPLPAPLPIPRSLQLFLTFTFLASFMLGGFCWILLALSDRVWNSTP